MSHSSTLITPRVSHRVSTSSLGGDNMALASDTLFDKFGLFDNSSLNSNPIQEAVTYPNFEPAFEDLDFTDLLEIKEEPLVQDESNNSDLHKDVDFGDSTMDPFFMDHSPILDDASLDSIKSDCMWSSVHLWNNMESLNNLNIAGNSNVAGPSNSRKRRRDVSLTLSECAEGLLAINHLDVNMLDDIATKQNTNNPTLGSSPSFLSSSFGALDEEPEDESLSTSEVSSSAMSSEAEDSSDSDDDEEEIIDVVSTDLVGSSARTRHTYSSRKTQNHSQIAKIEAGRSLLKKQFPKENQTTKMIKDQDKQTSILSDHSYFLTRPLEIKEETKPTIKGMLTPNESSEDEEETSLFSTGTPTIMTTAPLVDKRKIAQAVQSLMKNRNEPVNSNIKFKFRMKFKSTLAAANTWKKAAAIQARPVSTQHHLSQQQQQQQQQQNVVEEMEHSQMLMRERRKSASKNAFCPPPSSTNISPSSNNNNNKSSPVKQKKSSSNHNNTSPTSISSGSSLLARNKNDSEKCREIRDLHNSMERQRRVEQRNHLAYLKKQVPEVADVDKASKLTILRKAMEYCHLLANIDTRVRKERERELNRNQVLKKKLLELSQKLDSRRVTHSGRVASGWNNIRY